ncbi:MAG: metallophosphoesterase [Acidobacteriota bacterium]
MLRRLAILLSLLVGFWVQLALDEPAIGRAAQPARQQPAASAQTAPPPEQVRAIAAPVNPLPAEAASAEVTRFSFIVYGDTRGRRDGVQEQYEHSLIVDSMVATIKRLASGPFPVRFVLQSGDAVVNGRDARQWNKSFVDLINRITTEGGVPYSLAPGNHDVSGSDALESPMRKEGLRNYLAAIANLIPPNGAARRLDGYPTYAFGYGNAFFIALDSNIATDDKQFEWVKSQLEGLDRKRYRHIVAFFHHPPFSSGPHGGAVVEPPSAALRARYMPLFRRHHVAILFTGHEHLFEHWVERYEDSDGNKRRIDQIVTGGGGAPLYPYRGEPDLREYLKTYASEKVSLDHVVRPGMNPGDNPYHFLVVQVDGDRIRLEIIGVDWGRGFQPYRSNRTELQDANR